MVCTWRNSSISFCFPVRSSICSNSGNTSKWSSMLRLLRLVTKMISSTPAATASSTIYCKVGLSTSGSISFGITLLAGSTLVPRPATGNTALRMRNGTSSNLAGCVVSLLLVHIVEESSVEVNLSLRCAGAKAWSDTFRQGLTPRLVPAHPGEEGGCERLHNRLVHYREARDQLNARPIWP